MRRPLLANRLVLPASGFAITAGLESFRLVRNGELVRCVSRPCAPHSARERDSSAICGYVDEEEPGDHEICANPGESRIWRSARQENQRVRNCLTETPSGVAGTGRIGAIAPGVRLRALYGNGVERLGSCSRAVGTCFELWPNSSSHRVFDPARCWKHRIRFRCGTVQRGFREADLGFGASSCKGRRPQI